MNAHEYELSHELEQSLEGELGGLHELELELSAESPGLHELEQATPSHELHELHELAAHEAQAEALFKKLARAGVKLGGSPALRRLALSAARRVLAAPEDGEYEVQLEIGELEAELNPVRRVYLDAQMEHLGHAAAEAESEEEAVEAFLPLAGLALRALPIAGRLAARLAPRVVRLASRYIPRLTSGVSQLVRTLHRSPTTRPLLRIVPRIARNTAVQLARHVAAGRPLTAQNAVRLLAGQTARVLGDPRRVDRAWRRSRALDRRHHRAHPGASRRRRTGRPAGAHVHGPVCAACGR